MKICGKDFHVRGRFIRIAGLVAEGYDFLDDPEATLDALGRSGVGIDVLTFIPRLSNGAPKHGYRFEWDNMAALPVSTFEHWWTRQIRDKTRNMVRRAEKKGVVVREVPFDDGLVRGISAIYNESPVRQGKPFWHYGKDLDAVRSENVTFVDRSIFIGAFLGETLIGFSKLVCDERRGQAGGRKQQDGLSDFKEHNGFQGVELPRYYVPVTLVGRVALRFGLHHRLVERIPEPALAKLRKLRSRWYGSRLDTARKAA